jgi:hypothetical protein
MAHAKALPLDALSSVPISNLTGKVACAALSPNGISKKTAIENESLVFLSS